MDESEVEAGVEQQLEMTAPTNYVQTQGFTDRMPRMREYKKKENSSSFVFVFYTPLTGPMPGGPAALPIGGGADSTGCTRIGCRRGVWGFFFSHLLRGDSLVRVCEG